MTIDRAILRFAGCVVLMTLLLSMVHSRHWLWLTTFAGVNLIQASFTGFCPVVRLFKAMGIKPGRAFD